MNTRVRRSVKASEAKIEAREAWDRNAGGIKGRELIGGAEVGMPPASVDRISD